MNKHIKGLLPSSFYHLKCRHVEIEDQKIKIVWTVDVGNESYRNLIRYYPLDDVGVSRLDDMMQSLGRTLLEPVEENLEQFLELRTKAKVDRKVDGNLAKNIILEYHLPEQPEDYNIMKEKSDDHFFHTKQERNLPI